MEGSAVTTATAKPSEIELLKSQLAAQQKQIDQLRQMLLAMQPRPASDIGSVATAAAAPQPPAHGAEIASLSPMIPSSAFAIAVPVPLPPQGGNAVPDSVRLDALQKAMDALNGNLRGFRLSGDLRFRNDLLYRAANKDLPPGDNRATPAQRDRERYRFRLNVDKDLFYSEKSGTAMAHAHVQLATDPFNNPNTMDSDFTGVTTRAPISISEAYMDVTPLKGLTLRMGRTPVLFADNRQFMYDDDIRLNGFHETYRVNGKNGLYLQVGAAQYILTEPNIQILPAGSPFIAAGYKQGQRVPSSNLFDTGITIGANINKKWSINATGDYSTIREPNQLALAATANGAALFANSSVLGATLISNLPETGNALTAAGGAAFFAPGFDVIHGGLNLNYSGTQMRGHNYPFTLFGQVTHNKSTGIDNNGYMMGTAIGQAARLGDMQFQYQYFYKPANAFVSTLTDDDVGTGAGVNVKTHEIRLNFGLTRFLAWENRFYVQKGISLNNPAINFFLPLQAGYNSQLRIHSQFVFTF